MDDFNIILDVSSIYWDEQDYIHNQSNYYELVNGVTDFFRQLENEQPKVLLSANLINELSANFPFGKPPHYGSDFESQTLKFLSKVEKIEFPCSTIGDIFSIPNIIKSHYSQLAKIEIKRLIKKIHVDEDVDNVYFTFKYIWKENKKLKTQFKSSKKEYETIVADRNSELEDFLAKRKPVFEHNPKHNKTGYNSKAYWEISEDKLGFKSQLSCYNGVDNEKPQEILDKRYPQKIDSRYISYDKDNDVFVVFRAHEHGENKYHGYDEYNEDNYEKIPVKVRKYFNR